MGYKKGYLLFDNRSGSTYLSALLNRYRNIDVSLESYYTTHVLDYDGHMDSIDGIAPLLDHLYAEVQFQELRIDREILRANLESMPTLGRMQIIDAICQLQFNGRTAPLRLIKDPVYRYVDLIHRHDPQAFFVHIFRDGRGVHQSKARSRSITGQLMSESVIKSAVKWRQRFLEVENSGVPANQVINVRYEDLIADPDHTCETILANLGISDLKITKSIEDYHNSIGENQRELHSNLSKGTLKGNIESWRTRLSPYEIRLYQSLTSKELLAHGYTIVDVHLELSELVPYYMFCTSEMAVYLIDLSKRVWAAIFVNRNVRERWRIFFSKARIQ